MTVFPLQCAKCAGALDQLPAPNCDRLERVPWFRRFARNRVELRLELQDEMGVEEIAFLVLVPGCKAPPRGP